MDSSDAENDTQPTALRRNLLKLTAGVGATAVVGSSSVTGYSHDDNDSVNVDYTPSTGSVSFASPEDGATEQNPVTFEMEATDFTIEPASSGVSDGADVCSSDLVVTPVGIAVILKLPLRALG